MRLSRHFLTAACTGLLITGALAQLPERPVKKEKEKKEAVTQTLELLPEPPPTITAETARLAFHVAPLSAKGLLTHQVEDALKVLDKEAQGGSIVKLRAFVSGTGDMRRVATIVSETFTKKKKPLPVVNVIRVGALPLNGAQVVLEGVSLSKKMVNPNGLLFISGQQSREPIDPADTRIRVGVAAGKSIESLRSLLVAHGLVAADMARVTCFSSSLDDADAVHTQLAAAFPAATLDLVQVQRAVADRMVECEGVARLHTKPSEPVLMDNPTKAAFARAAIAAPDRVLFTGTQMAFGSEDADVRLAFTRLRTTLTAAGTSLDRVFYLTAYPSNAPMLDKFRRLRFEFLNRDQAPASTNLAFEGLPSLDASLGMEVIAALSN